MKYLKSDQLQLKTLIGLGILTVSLSACGVRDETTETGSNTSSQTSTGTTLTTTTNTGSSPNPTAGSAMGEEGNGNFVELNFTDAYTGYWENESRSSSLTTQVIRLTYGERYYHVEYFDDQSSGSGSTGLNCYIRNGLQLAVQAGNGLRPAAQVDRTDSYTEYTLEGSKFQSSSYDGNGDLQTNSTGTATYKRVFSGLSAADLQVCTD